MKQIKQSTKSKRNLLEWITDVYILLMLCHPLWMYAGGYAEILYAKKDYFIGVTLFYIACVVVLFLEQKLIGVEMSYLKFRHKKFCAVLGLYLMFCLISTCLSQWRDIAIWGLADGEGFLIFVLYAMVFFFVSQLGRIHWWYLIPVVVSVVCNGVLSILQYFGKNPFLLYGAGYTYYDGNLKYGNTFMGTIGNVNYFSAYLAMVVIALVLAFVLYQNRLTKWLPIPIFFGMVAMVFCESTCGLVGLAVALVLLSPWVIVSGVELYRSIITVGVLATAFGVCNLLQHEYTNDILRLYIQGNGFAYFGLCVALFCTILGVVLYPKQQSILLDEKKTTKIISSLVVFGCVCGMAGLYLIPFSTGMIGEIHSMMHGDIQETFGTSRVKVWQEVIPLVPEKFWFGGGPDTLSQRVNYVFTRYIPELDYIVTSNITTAHNDFLNILVNTGVFALLAYIGFLVGIAKEVFQNCKNPIVLVLSGSILAYLVQVCFSASTCMVSPLYWLALGLLVATSKEKKDCK